MPDTRLAVETLTRVDPDFRALVQATYPGLGPDEVWDEVFGKAMPDPADLHVPTTLRAVRTRKVVSKGLLSTLGIGATLTGGVLGASELSRSVSEFKNAGEAVGDAKKATGLLGGIKAAHPKGYAAAKIGAVGSMLGGDAIATSQQMKKPKPVPVTSGVAVPTGAVSKGVLSDLVNTAIDSGARASKNLYRGLRNGEQSSDVVRPIKTGEKAAKAEVPKPKVPKPETPVNPLVSGKRAYKVGQFAGTKNGKKAIAGGTGATLLLSHHERNVGANQAYAAQYGKSDTVWEAAISKTDVAKRQVFGYASVVQKDGLAVTDRQGDIITPDDMEDAAYDFVLNSRVGGNMHKRDAFDRPHHVSDLIESFAVTPEKLKELGIPAEIAKNVPVGWWVGFKVWDDDAWQDVVDGKLQGFSIHGRGIRVPAGDELMYA